MRSCKMCIIKMKIMSQKITLNLNFSRSFLLNVQYSFDFGMKCDPDMLLTGFSH